MEDFRGDPRVDELLFRWQELFDQGQSASPEELCSTCPELADALRWRIALLRRLDRMLHGPTTDHLDALPPPAAGAPSRSSATALAEFQDLCFHARGGLGEVFVGCQQELDRPVALKRIRADRFHEAARMRFLREVAITARLQHPGIVPIHGLGEDQDGPFYTMPFIRGITLQAAIRNIHEDEDLRCDTGRRSLELRKLLQRFITVCDTMAYAHDQGVVHRDLKPSNVMLGHYGETLVMDWGLAKRYHADPADPGGGDEIPGQSPSSDDMTATGAVLGTPRYMSPEQASGKPAGPASDLYSLGVILYAILTNTSPYRESPAADPLQPVREAAQVPPRARDKTIPRALEAICLKAMSARPQERHDSARALSEDLSRWLADEPVSAYREGLSARLTRWTRRHRASVQAAALALLVVAVLASTAAVVVDTARRREEAAGARVMLALANERAAKAEAQANLSLAAQAVDDYLTKISENALLKRQDAAEVRDLRSLRKELLEVALDYYNRLATRPSPEPALAAARAAAYTRVGHINDEIGSKDAALEAFRQAVAIRNELATLDPADVERRRDLASSQIDVADALAEIGRAEDALREYARSQEILDSMAGADPADAETQSELARAHNGGGIMLRTLGRSEDALAAFERARAALQRLMGAGSATAKQQSRLATAHSNIGLLLDELRRTEEAVAALEQSRAIVGRLVEADPNNSGLQNDLAVCDNNLGLVFTHTARLEDALAVLARGRPIFERLVGAHPSVTSYRRDLATNHINSGNAHAGLRHVAQALREFEQGRTILQPMVAADPSDMENRCNLAATLYNIADIQRENRKVAAAREAAESAFALLKKTGQRAPLDEFILSLAHDLSADLYDKEGRPLTDRDRAERESHVTEALGSLRRAIDGGYRNIDPNSFPALRARPEFQDLMRDLAFPEWPFATGPPL
jgi:eukaryotic-like serine/threonine-protein kinase